MVYPEKKENGPRRDFKKNEGRVYVNEDIRAYKILIIDEDGTNLGIFSRFDALAKAQEEGKDLVQMSYNPTDNISTVKLVDYGKYMYSQKKEASQKKKTQKAKGMKEVKFGYNIGENDLNLKLKKAKEFLEEGYSVKFVGVLRGRERDYRSKMIERLEDVAKQLEANGRSQGVKEDKGGYSMVLLAKLK